MAYGSIFLSEIPPVTRFEIVHFLLQYPGVRVQGIYFDPYTAGLTLWDIGFICGKAVGGIICYYDLRWTLGFVF